MNRPNHYIFLKSDLKRKVHAIYVKRGETVTEVASCEWGDETNRMKLENLCLRLQNSMMEYAIQAMGN